IHIENKLEVMGGDDFAMLSDNDIPVNYAAWEKSLNNHASLMGIKDPGKGGAGGVGWNGGNAKSGNNGLSGQGGKQI
ncbi:MAG: hypothetical protein IJ800_02125, partial [Clostridia bacterium]|nr:hypothetical protein [Clostridia bacterium]